MPLAAALCACAFYAKQVVCPIPAAPPPGSTEAAQEEHYVSVLKDTVAPVSRWLVRDREVAHQFITTIIDLVHNEIRFNWAGDTKIAAPSECPAK
jgi:hypothetical protein